MAYGKRRTGGYRRSTKQSGRETKTQKLTRLAYQMGQVEKGLKNPDSRISESYNRGCNSAKRQKKTLF